MVLLMMMKILQPGRLDSELMLWQLHCEATSRGPSSSYPAVGLRFLEPGAVQEGVRIRPKSFV